MDERTLYPDFLPRTRCTADMRSAVATIAKEEGVKYSEVMRRAVRFYLRARIHKSNKSYSTNEYKETTNHG